MHIGNFTKCPLCESGVGATRTWASSPHGSGARTRTTSAAWLPAVGPAAAAAAAAAARLHLADIPTAGCNRLVSDTQSHAPSTPTVTPRPDIGCHPAQDAIAPGRPPMRSSRLRGSGVALHSGPHVGAPPRSSPLGYPRARAGSCALDAQRAPRRGSADQPRCYALRDEWTRLAPWEQNVTRVKAHALWHPDDVLCLESAAALGGLPVIGGSHDIHVLGSRAATTRRAVGVRVHTASSDDRRIVERDGIRMTSVADTCIDIARSRHAAVALAVADAAVTCDAALRPIDLVAMNEDRASSRGRRHARWPLHRADPGAESALESLSRACVEWHGIADPELQVRFGSGDRADLWWPSHAVVGEADGHLKYDGRFGDAVDALRAREERDRRLRGCGVRAVVHWTWDDIVHPTSLSAILRGAGLPVLAPPDEGRLASLRRILRPSPARETAPR